MRARRRQVPAAEERPKRCFNRASDWDGMLGGMGRSAKRARRGEGVRMRGSWVEVML